MSENTLRISRRHLEFRFCQSRLAKWVSNDNVKIASAMATESEAHTFAMERLPTGQRVGHQLEFTCKINNNENQRSQSVS